MSTSLPSVPTIGSIAVRLGVPVHRIRYVLDRHRIEPSGRAGNARVFNEEDVEHIASVLHRIDTERGQS